MKGWIFWLGLVLCLGVPGFMVYFKEQSLAQGGRIVYLQLAPVDPRSLLQGDYMALRYQLFPDRLNPGWPQQGNLIAQVDDRGVITAWTPESEGNLGVRIRYRTEKKKLVVASDAFHFQEGQGKRYGLARYGKFHLSPGGVLTLRALTDEHLQPL
jgi:uncharacterized membrane-anchored protein